MNFASITCTWIFSLTLITVACAEPQRHAAPTTRPTTNILLPAAMLDIAPSKAVILYFEQVHGDRWSYTVLAQTLIRQMFNLRPADKVTVMFWPDRVGEKDTSWLGREPARIIEEVSDRIQYGSAQPDPIAFQGRLQVCCDLAKRQNADLIVVDCVSGITELPPAQQKALAESSKTVTIHILSYMPYDNPKALVPLASGTVISIYLGEANVKRELPKGE